MTVTDTRRRGAPPLRAERRRGHLGGLSVAQLVCVEVAVVAVLASPGGPVWALPAAGVLAVVLLAGAFARRKNRWWFEHRVISRRFRERARAAAETPGRELAALAPGLAVTEIRERGTPIGVGRDDMGWFVALAVNAGDDATTADAALGVDRVGRILAESALPVSSLQVVTHLVPAPTSFLDHAAPAVQSYRELLGGLPIPADSRVWVAARLRPADALAASASRGGGPEGVHRALAALLGRIGKTLDSAGLVSTPLTATELTAAVATVAGLTGAAVTGDAPAEAVRRENWAGWQGTEAVHVGFLATRLSPSGLSVAARRLTEVGALAATVAVVLNRQPDGDLRMQAIVDVAARATTAAETLSAVVGIFNQCGIALRRLDGQHAAAIYATAPTGGAIG
ncbi:type VII secretion protein EccE [Catenuloplanes nepalensis]|uniref:Type VII secretion protein EccE n=1 Tax=Catenuloplanes nepalensis TaxID=587533 RepID=A0ABT9N1L7_9ACTN|nr:type VII secretion protein EccE [Catenuloplanes nepalensis]MDP9797589.1 type VII secretion protein EccE [Catenuloplanes nepalensis]